DVVKMIKEKEVKWADLRFTDTRGKEQHVSIPARYVLLLAPRIGKAQIRPLHLLLLDHLHHIA
ncbi:MAG: hypothetical protein ACLQFF_13285, partial [Steroidobacteraceae bacterium]